MRCAALLLVGSTLLWGQASYEGLFRDAAGYIARGDYDGAIHAYESAVKLRPAAAEAHANLAVVFQTAGRYRDAERSARRALELQPRLLPARIVLGLVLLKLSRPEEAIPELEAALDQAPGQRDAALGLAAARLATQDLAGAAALYQAAIARAPGDLEALYGAAICYERMAERDSRRLARMPGGQTYFHRLLAEHLVDRGAGRLAELSLAAPGAAPPEPAAQKLYQEIRTLAGLARAAFEKVVEVAPDSWQSHIFLGDVARQVRDFETAIRHYSAAARLQPDNAGALLGLGTVYWELGRNQEAANDLRRAVELLPGSVQGWFALGDIALKEHRDQDALALLEKCLRLDPEHSGAHAAMGKALYHLGRFAEAVPHLQRGLATDIYGDVHYQLGQALIQEGRREEGSEALRESARLRQRQLGIEQQLKQAGR